MNIAIIGSGAMGCFFGSLFARSGRHHVTLISRNRHQIRQIRRSGVKLSGSNKQDEFIRVNIDFAPNVEGPVDVLLVTVKCYDSDSAIRCARHLIGADTFVGTFQNGLGNMECISKDVAPNKIFCGNFAHSVMRLDYNHIHYAGGNGKLRLAPYMSRSLPEFREIAEALDIIGVDLEIVDDWRKIVWNKVLMNTGANALSAITSLSCRKLYENPYLRTLMRLAVREASEVAQASGACIDIDYKDAPEEPLFKALQAMGDNETTMLQDIKKGNRSEIDSLNLAIVREGKKAGIQTPVNEVLGLLIQSLEYTDDRVEEAELISGERLQTTSSMLFADKH